jgi:hypothetical protein
MTDEQPTAVRPEISAMSNDMLVFTDLASEVVVDVEKHRVDEAVLLRHTAMTVIKAAKEMIAALDTHLCDVMEFGDAVLYKGWEFRKGRTKERERFDHDEIGKRILHRVDDVAVELHPDEVPQFFYGVHVGADVALRTMRDIYLSDSTKAKTGQLDRYGIPRDPRKDDSVRTYQKGDPYIKVEPIMSEPQE